MKAFGIVLLALLSLPVFSSPIPDFPFVTVTGESTRKVTPDQAKIQLQVLVFDKQAATAHNLLNETVDKVLNVLEQHQVATHHIVSFEIDKRTKRARNSKSYEDLEILGYEFSQRFEITLNILTYYSDITAGLNRINNVVNISSQFDVSNRDDITIELIAEAGHKAKTKAKQLAAGLGVKIDSVFAINDSGSYQSFFATFGLNTQSYEFSRAEGMAFQVQSMFIPEFIEISKSVNVVYKLED
ncbi:MAG: SIMPL domain-containing protein [Gammaproteobacteria bacterium]|nr:SIMPL domain-containing protein [Gammaproteobacteria bacterium]